MKKKDLLQNLFLYNTKHYTKLDVLHIFKVYEMICECKVVTILAILLSTAVHTITCFMRVEQHRQSSLMASP